MRTGTRRANWCTQIRDVTNQRAHVHWRVHNIMDVAPPLGLYKPVAESSRLLEYCQLPCVSCASVFLILGSPVNYLACFLISRFDLLLVLLTMILLAPKCLILAWLMDSASPGYCV